MTRPYAFCTKCGAYLVRFHTIVRMPSSEYMNEPYQKPQLRTYCIYEAVHEEVG